MGCASQTVNAAAQQDTTGSRFAATTLRSTHEKIAVALISYFQRAATIYTQFYHQ